MWYSERFSARNTPYQKTSPARTAIRTGNEAVPTTPARLCRPFRNHLFSARSKTLTSNGKRPSCLPRIQYRSLVRFEHRIDNAVIAAHSDAVAVLSSLEFLTGKRIRQEFGSAAMNRVRISRGSLSMSASTDLAYLALQFIRRLLEKFLNRVTRFM